MGKKQAFLLAAVLSAGLLLSGCSSEAENPPPAESEASAETQAAPTASAKITIDGTKFVVDGKEIWINGVNTPWDNWNDFGGTDSFDEAFWDQHFSDLKAANINCTRVWVNCSGMVGIKLKTTGEVKEVTEQHWTDLDKLFAIAEKYEIYVMPTLLSFDHFKDGNTGNDRWRMLISDSAKTQTFIDSYVIPFSQRYGGNEYLFGIDLMNEPDWVYENAECGKIDIKILSEFFAKCTAAIHENSDAMVTVGLGMIKYNSDSGKFSGNCVSDEVMKSYAGDNACLDFYSTHYYFWQNSFMGFPFELSPVEFGLDGTKPCVIGECSADSSESGRTLAQEYESAYNNGWNGVMAWTSNGVDACGDLEDIRPAARKIMELAKDKVYPLGE